MPKPRTGSCSIRTSSRELLIKGRHHGKRVEMPLRCFCRSSYYCIVREDLYEVSCVSALDVGCSGFKRREFCSRCKAIVAGKPSRRNRQTVVEWLGDKRHKVIGRNR